MRVSPAADPRNPTPQRVTVKDRNLGDISLAWEPLDVVLSDKGHWVGINDKFINRVLQELHGIPTWPKRITHIHFDNAEAKAVFDKDQIKILIDENKVSKQRLDLIIEDGLKALDNGEIISVFPFKIIAKPGTRMTARYLHEVY